MTRLTVISISVLFFAAASSAPAADNKHADLVKTFEASADSVYAAMVQAAGGTLKSAIKEACTINFLTATGNADDTFFGTAICRNAGDGKTSVTLSLQPNRANAQIFRVQNTRDKIASNFWAGLEGSLKANAVQHSSPAETAPTSPSSNSELATITIRSTPDGADIAVDGRFSGNAPAVLRLPSGEHSIRVSSAGFRNWERIITVTAGGSTTLNAVLDREP
jgi:hypothetical protein